MESIIREAQEANMLHGELGRILLRNYEMHKGISWQQRGVNVAIVMVVLEVIGFILNLPTPVLYVPFVVAVILLVVFAYLFFVHAFRAVGIQLRPPPPDPARSVAPSDTDQYAEGDESRDPHTPSEPEG